MVYLNSSTILHSINQAWGCVVLVATDTNTQLNVVLKVRRLFMPTE